MKNQQFNLPLRAQNSHSELGVTLIELMISMALGLLVVLAGTAMLVQSKNIFISQTDGAETQDSARFALDNIARSVRQTGYINYDSSNDNGVQVTPEAAPAGLLGLDANSVTATSTDISSPLGYAVNFSDVLATRFYGSGTVGNGDGTVVNCAGFSVAAATSGNSADVDRGWSIYYVSNDAAGDPQLMCKYYNAVNGTWSAQAIARGVESFQVIYGVDINNDGIADRFLSASQINDLDNTLVLVGSTAQERADNKNLQTFWKRITTIKIALLIRGKENSRTDVTISDYKLFGPDYAAANGSNDAGTTISEVNLPAATKNRARKIYSQTIQIRNYCITDGSKGKCTSSS